MMQFMGNRTVVSRAEYFLHPDTTRTPLKTVRMNLARGFRADAPVASSTLLYSYLSATIGSTRTARRAGI